MSSSPTLPVAGMPRGAVGCWGARGPPLAGGWWPGCRLQRLCLWLPLLGCSGRMQRGRLPARRAPTPTRSEQREGGSVPAGPARGKAALTPISRAPWAIFTLSPCPCPVWARAEGEKQPPGCLKSQFIAVNGAPPCRSPPGPAPAPLFAPHFARLTKVSGYSRRT